MRPFSPPYEDTELAGLTVRSTPSHLVSSLSLPPVNIKLLSTPYSARMSPAPIWTQDFLHVDGLRSAVVTRPEGMGPSGYRPGSLGQFGGSAPVFSGSFQKSGLQNGPQMVGLSLQRHPQKGPQFMGAAIVILKDAQRALAHGSCFSPAASAVPETISSRSTQGPLRDQGQQMNMHSQAEGSELTVLHALNACAAAH